MQAKRAKKSVSYAVPYETVRTVDRRFFQERGAWAFLPANKTAIRLLSIDDGKGIKEEPKTQRSCGAHNGREHKSCRVGAGEVNEPSRCGNTDDPGNGREGIAECEQHCAVAWCDIHIARR